MKIAVWLCFFANQLSFALDYTEARDQALREKKKIVVLYSFGGAKAETDSAFLASLIGVVIAEEDLSLPKNETMKKDPSLAFLKGKPGLQLVDPMPTEKNPYGSILAEERNIHLMSKTGVEFVLRQLAGSMTGYDKAVVEALNDLMPEARRRAIRNRLPEVEGAELAKAMWDPYTFWYTEETIPAFYQNNQSTLVSGFRSAIFGRRDPNIDGHFFSGSKFAFPMGHTAGTHTSPNVETVKFIRFPGTEHGEPGVALDVIDSGTAGFSGHLDYWTFRGLTLVGELLSVVNPASKQSHVFEIRTRVKTDTQWVPDAFRPFPGVDVLISALEKQSAEVDTADIAALINYLKREDTLTSFALEDSSNAFSYNPRLQVSFRGYQDPLPAMPAALVISLLENSVFKSAKGAVWKKVGVGPDAKEVYAPTTADPFGIVPTNYGAGPLPVGTKSCMTCHRDVARPFQEYWHEATLYGNNWGSDYTFSFLPFSPGSRSVRPCFARLGLVVQRSSLKPEHRDQFKSFNQ